MPFSLGIYTNNIAELVVDNALCGEILESIFNHYSIQLNSIKHDFFIHFAVFTKQ